MSKKELIKTIDGHYDDALEFKGRAIIYLRAEIPLNVTVHEVDALPGHMSMSSGDYLTVFEVDDFDIIEVDDEETHSLVITFSVNPEWNAELKETVYPDESQDVPMDLIIASDVKFQMDLAFNGELLLGANVTYGLPNGVSNNVTPEIKVVPFTTYGEVLAD